MSDRRPYALLSAILLLVAGCAGGGTAATPSPADPGASGGQAAPSGSTNATDFDRAFIDMMVPHHEAAVAMGEIAVARAEHEELRELANEIISDQQAEIDTMKGYREAWFGSAETPGMDAMPLLPGMEMPGMPGHGGGTMDMTADVEALREAEPFDLAFIDAMIPHHEQAVEAARMAINAAGTTEIRTLATGIIEAQEREIEQLREWRAAWYPNG